MVQLASFDREVKSLSWQDGLAGNLNADEVPLIIHNELIAGLEETEDADIAVYPNPARTTLTVEANETIRQIRLLDVSGQVIKLIEVNALNHNINVEDLNTGIYFVEMLTAKGVVTKKVQILR